MVHANVSYCALSRLCRTATPLARCVLKTPTALQRHKIIVHCKITPEAERTVPADVSTVPGLGAYTVKGLAPKLETMVGIVLTNTGVFQYNLQPDPWRQPLNLSQHSQASQARLGCDQPPPDVVVGPAE